MRAICCASGVLSLLLLSAPAGAQDLAPETRRPSGPEVPSLGGPPAYVTLPEGAAPPPLLPPAPDDWLFYRRPGSCCGPTGGDGPIETELYLRAGVSFPIGGGVYARILQTGWAIQGGGRALFFNPSHDAAWVVDLGILNVWNHANRPDVPLPLTVTVPGFFGIPTVTTLNATADDLNRTLGSIGFGRDWWLGSLANGFQLRWGVEGGMRYGSASAQFHEIRHRTDTLGGAFVGLHADLEWSCGGCTFFTGLHTEYEYTWSRRLLQSESADVADLLLMATFGIRF